MLNLKTLLTKVLSQQASSYENLTTSSVNVRILRCGKIRVLEVENPTELAKGDNLMLTLPSNDRPLYAINTMLIPPVGAISAGGTQLSIRLTVRPNGEVKIYNYRSEAISGNTNASGSITWITT